MCIVKPSPYYAHKFGVPVYVHSKDSALLKDPRLNLSGFFGSAYEVKSEIKVLEENAIIELDGLELKVLHIPGHTPGGIALLMQKPTKKIVFTGDSLFCQGIGRTDLAGGDESLLKNTIKEKLFCLDDDTVVYPGHGPTSTIGEEKRNNPFLG